jgi:hypothetical protein
MRLLILFLAVMIIPLAAQTDRANLTGTVSDQSKAAIPGANVTVTAASTGAEHSAVTSAAGVYTISSLPVGEYTASVKAAGFEPIEVEAFTLNVAETRTMNVTLLVGSISSKVTVVDAAPALDQTSAEIGAVIQGSQTDALPVNGRYWATLMVLAPGAMDSGSGTQDQIRFAGLSQEDNNFRFDGVDATGINHQFQKEPARLQFSMESIAEFRATSAAYGADVGGQPGGQVEIVSKTGTNQFHGSLYEFLRNSAFDARQWNAAAVSPFKMNNFGSSLGGYLIRNKLFFFADYEAVRQVFYQQSSGLVPTDAFRAKVLQKSPALASILNAYPEGSLPSNDPNALLWVGTGRNPTNEDSGLIRADYSINEKTSAFIRFNTDNYRTTSPVGLGEQQVTTLTTPNAVIDLQRTFSASFLNDARFGFNRAAYENGGSTKLPYTVTVTGFGSYSLPDPSLRHDNSFDIVDNATWVKGRHTFKAGVEIRRVQENKSSPSIPKEALSFLSETDFINDKLDSDSYGSASPRTGVRKTSYFGYIKDEFKLRRNITLNLGLRYEYYGVEHEVNGRGQVFDPYTCGLQYCPAGSPWYFPNTKDLAPRLSVAWAPEALHGKTVIRVGSGIYYGEGQFGGLAALSNIAYSYTLTQKNIPGLTYPVTPFLNQAAYSSAISARDRNRKDQAIDQWTFSIQHEIAHETTFQTTYMGSKGTHLFRKDLQLNGIDPATGKRPYASLTNSTIGWVTDDGNSNFNALQIGLRRNMSTGLLISANYQWSHGIGDGATGGGESDVPENMNCRACERGSTDFDIRHYFTSSAIWQLPVGKGHRLLGDAPAFLNGLLGGWRLSGVGIARTGLPLNVTLSRSASALPDGINASERPDIVPGQPLYPSAGQTTALWLNPYAFTLPANGTWGNAGRNIVRAPGIWQMDTSLDKRFPIRERLALSFRVDVFNLLNHAQLGKPNVKWTDPTKGTNFGVITTPYTSGPIGTGTPRQMQLNLRLEF